MKEEVLHVFAGDDKKTFEISLAGISYCDGTYQIDRPNSDVYCFEYIISGSGSVTCGKYSFTASAGDVYMLEAGKSHFYYSSSEDPWVKIWFNLKGSLVSALLSTYELAGINHIENAGEPAKKLFEEFLENVRENKDDPQLITKNAEEIFFRIIRYLYDFRSETVSNLTDGEKLKNYIDFNAGKNISIKDLAAVLYRSNSQTIRIFKSEFGMTPYEYIMQRKIEAAKHMLKNTVLLIKEISYRLGFCDEHYFSGYFKSRTGVSPLEYRRMHKNHFKQIKISQKREV